MSSQSSTETIKKKRDGPITHTWSNASKAQFAVGVEFQGKKMKPMQLMENDGSQKHKKKKDKDKKKKDKKKKDKEKKKEKKEKKAKKKASQQPET